MDEFGKRASVPDGKKQMYQKAKVSVQPATGESLDSAPHMATNSSQLNQLMLKLEQGIPEPTKKRGITSPNQD